MPNLRQFGMSAWALKLGSVLTTLLVLAGSVGYAGTHLKNAHAPLQPPLANKAVAVVPSASPAAPTATLPPLVPLRGRTRPPSAQGTPIPSLQPNVRTADLPPITFTHVS
ncbi:MAG: hypothetical protein AUH85_04910 [Chloroflexi bacterium 13_1_40CM_4_68_4]|nr:MAG: hypothetical protein AUH85_04910 [Chloroflexi bacterium 13_1_40CM_4_68_4]